MDSPVSPFYGKINPFYGKINPFYGRISPFWGDTTQFWGKINPFYETSQPIYGSADPFWGTISPFKGNNASFYATIQPFWESAGPQWGTINTTWSQLQAANATDYSSLQSQLQAFVTSASNFWSTTIKKGGGKSFIDTFADPLFARYGIDPNNTASLANASEATRSAFFLAWYDGLMAYAGTDHVDWWMGSINWSPELTQIQNPTGIKYIVGLLDTSPSHSDPSLLQFQILGGYKKYVNAHGAGVASLIAARQDGKGIMGVAPNVDVLDYNPFDSTGTASWDDVQAGLIALTLKGAPVINMSLGVPGAVLTNEWGPILTNPTLALRSVVYVKAAGNEGVTQTADVAWPGTTAPTDLIVVGSVTPTGDISAFSNTPGEACILVKGICLESNKLKYDFIVAPGENVLVSDGDGGVVRRTGTSFSAPLVTGTVALLQARWPWLQQHPTETVQIILRSARDLGAPGVDPVYGWGELNVQAAQSPLSFNNLVVYQPLPYKNGSPAVGPAWTIAGLRTAILKPGQLNLWQTQGAYITAFETIGATYRDFTIPLSSLLAGKKQISNGASNTFQSYLYQRLIDWAGGVSSAQFRSGTAPLEGGIWTLSMTATAISPDDTRPDRAPFHVEFTASNDQTGTSLHVGDGNGASALTGQTTFSLTSDFDPSTGGVNPILGFASGGAYGQASFAVATNVRVRLGYSQKSDDHSTFDPIYGVNEDYLLNTYKASASVIGMDYAVAPGVSLNLTYTDLSESDGLLGAQGSGLFNFSGGSRTSGTTLGASVDLSDGWQLAGSATVARSTANSDGLGLSIAGSSMISTAYELVATKSNLLQLGDQLRLSITQPLHVENGALKFDSIQIVDRQTGRLGASSSSWDVSGERENRFETLYAMPILDHRAEIEGFGLLDLNAPTAVQDKLSFAIGCQFRIGL